MRVPATISELAQSGIIKMYDHPQNHYDWRIRRTIYRQLVLHPEGPLVHRWLAVLAAEHVLPIFINSFPNNNLPIQLLDMARRVVKGEVEQTSEEVYLLHEEGYHFYWEGLPEASARYAGWATYKALVEVSGASNMLENVAELTMGACSSGEIVMSMGAADEQGRWEKDFILTDEDIAHLAAYSDTASSAAIASAYSLTESAINTRKLSMFWEWWVYEALPQSCRLASVIASN